MKFERVYGSTCDNNTKSCSASGTPGLPAHNFNLRHETNLVSSGVLTSSETPAQHDPCKASTLAWRLSSRPTFKQQTPLERCADLQPMQSHCRGLNGLAVLPKKLGMRQQKKTFRGSHHSTGAPRSARAGQRFFRWRMSDFFGNSHHAKKEKEMQNDATLKSSIQPIYIARTCPGAPPSCLRSSIRSLPTSAFALTGAGSLDVPKVRYPGHRACHVVRQRSVVQSSWPG